MARREFDVRHELELLEGMYDDFSESFSALVMGEFGSGKTQLAKTCVKPVLLFSFDPKGTIVLREEIKSGEVLPVTFWNENSKDPKEYSRFEDLLESYLKNNFLEKFGTVMIDSGTTFLQALANEVGRRNNRQDGKLAIQDYIVIYNTVQDIIKLISSRKTNFILTMHLIQIQDELTGELIRELDTYKGLKTKIPILFTEKYALTEVVKRDKVEHYLLTSPYENYRASTQLGTNGIFETKEEPNIKKLMEKAGFDTTDKVDTIEMIRESKKSAHGNDVR